MSGFASHAVSGIAVGSIGPRRVAARLIDIVFTAIGLAAPILATDPFRRRGLSVGLGYGLAVMAWIAFYLMVVWPAYEVFGVRRGATPGKKLMGIRLVGADGGLPTRAEAVRRAGLVLIPTEIVLLFGSAFTFAEHNPIAGASIGVAVVAPSLIPILFGHRTWVDRATHTTVIRASVSPPD